MKKDLSVASSAESSNRYTQSLGMSAEEINQLLLECDELLENVSTLVEGKPLAGKLVPDTNLILLEALGGIKRRIGQVLEMTEHNLN